MEVWRKGCASIMAGALRGPQDRVGDSPVYILLQENMNPGRPSCAARPGLLLSRPRPAAPDFESGLRIPNAAGGSGRRWEALPGSSEAEPCPRRCPRATVQTGGPSLTGESAPDRGVRIPSAAGAASLALPSQWRTRPDLRLGRCAIIPDFSEVRGRPCRDARGGALCTSGGTLPAPPRRGKRRERWVPSGLLAHVSAPPRHCVQGFAGECFAP